MTLFPPAEQCTMLCYNCPVITWRWQHFWSQSDLKISQIQNSVGKPPHRYSFPWSSGFYGSKILLVIVMMINLIHFIGQWIGAFTARSVKYLEWPIMILRWTVPLPHFNQLLAVTVNLFFSWHVLFQRPVNKLLRISERETTESNKKWNSLFSFSF